MSDQTARVDLERKVNDLMRRNRILRDENRQLREQMAQAWSEGREAWMRKFPHAIPPGEGQREGA